MSINSLLFSPTNTSAVETAQTCSELLQSYDIDFEAMLASAYRQFLRAGDTAIDIGAHAGYHFTRLKDVVGPNGRVIGFEPLPEFADHIIFRHGGDAEIIQKALSTAPGAGTFLYMANRPGESGFKERTYTDDRGTRQIQVTISTLDAELPDLTNCQFIKVDTEGHELSALSGGTGLISRTRPVIAIEYGKPTYSLYGHTRDSLWNWTADHGYQISDLFGNIINEQSEWHLVCDKSYWDYFLVPAEKSSEWAQTFSQNPTKFVTAS